MKSSETTLGHNMYAYAVNNPVMYIDSNGNYAVEFWLYNSDIQEADNLNFYDDWSFYGVYASLFIGGKMEFGQGWSNKIVSGMSFCVATVLYTPGKIFDDSAIINPEMKFSFHVLKISAEVSSDFMSAAGIEAGVELYSIEGSLMITDSFGIEAEARVGIRVGLLFGADSTEVSVGWWSIRIVY